MNKDIYVGFSTPKSKLNLFSLAIRLIEKRNFSHCYIVIDGMVYHAAHGMVHAISYGNFLKKNNEIYKYEVNVEDQEFELGRTFLRKSLGISYGFDQILGLLIQKIFRKREPIIQNNSQRMICSEFSAKFLIACEIDIDISPDAITPSDLQNFLEVNYGKN